MSRYDKGKVESPAPGIVSQPLITASLRLRDRLSQSTTVPLFVFPFFAPCSLVTEQRIK